MRKFNFDFEFKPHTAFSSIPYLNLGCVGSCEMVCKIWNGLHKLDHIKCEVSVAGNNTLSVEAYLCHDPETLLQTLKYYLAFGVRVELKVDSVQYIAETYSI